MEEKEEPRSLPWAGFGQMVEALGIPKPDLNLCHLPPLTHPFCPDLFIWSSPTADGTNACGQELAMSYACLMARRQALESAATRPHQKNALWTKIASKLTMPNLQQVWKRISAGLDLRFPLPHQKGQLKSQLFSLSLPWAIDSLLEQRPHDDVLLTPRRTRLDPLQTFLSPRHDKFSVIGETIDDRQDAMAAANAHFAARADAFKTALRARGPS